MKKIVHIRNDDTYTLIDHPEDEQIGLQTLQQLVDGYIELVSTPTYDVWVNEEGLYRADFQPNVGAIGILALGFKDRYIVGPVAITGTAEDGESRGLDEHVATTIAGVLEGLGYRRESA